MANTAAAEMVEERLEAGRRAKAVRVGNLAMATAAGAGGPLGVPLEVSSAGVAAKASLAENMAMARAIAAKATGVATERLALAMAAKAPLVGNMAKAVRTGAEVPVIPTKTAVMPKAPTALGLWLRGSATKNVPAETVSRARKAVRRVGRQVKRTRLRRSHNPRCRAHLAR